MRILWVEVCRFAPEPDSHAEDTAEQRPPRKTHNSGAASESSCISHFLRRSGPGTNEQSLFSVRLFPSVSSSIGVRPAASRANDWQNTRQR